MTTAHRPTWKAAVGKASEGGWSAGGASSTLRSSLDAPAHTKLKFRAEAVDKKKALRESLFKLEQAEASSKTKAKKLLPKRVMHPAIEEEGRLKLLKQTAEVDEVKMRAKYDDADEGGNGDESDWSDANRSAAGTDESDLDASDSDASSSDDDDDDDDEEALEAELAKIRAEREVKQQKIDAEEVAQEEAQMEEAALLGNPLLAGGTGKLKRRWNDDVVFRNQAKGEPEMKKRFINDTVRNDFHKRFLNKFIQ